MALLDGPDSEKRFQELLDQPPAIRIFLKPIAPPAALGLAGFAGSTFVAASWIAEWWGSDSSPTIFFPFVRVLNIKQIGDITMEHDDSLMHEWLIR